VLPRRCGRCHRHQARGLPIFKASLGFDFWAVSAGAKDWENLRRQMPLLGDTPVGSERLYNLTTPEKSPILLAPLAKKAGGWGVCGKAGGAVFAATDEADYRRILEDIRFTKAALDRQKRFDMPGFRPGAHYVREMKRYGILPPRFDPARDPVNVYDVEGAYFRSHWYRAAAPR